MSENAPITEDETFDPRLPAGMGTQVLALGTAACFGIGLYLGNLALGVALSALLLTTMSLGTGSRLILRRRDRARARSGRVLRHAVSPR